MKLKFWVDVNTDDETFDVSKLGYTASEWEALTEMEKMREVEAWADNYISMGYEVVDE